jgi:hypothetical protein
MVYFYKNREFTVIVNNLLRSNQITITIKENVAERGMKVMKKTGIKVRYPLIIIVVLALLIGSYVGVGNLFGENQSNASEKTDVEIEDENSNDGEEYVYENDDSLFVTGEDIDVSGKTYKQVKEEMEKEAEENGGVIGD